MGEVATARLFVALDLPGTVLDALVAWRAPVLAARRELRAVPVESLHVTLAFLGSLPEGEIPALCEAVTGCVAPESGAVAGLSLAAPLWLPRRRPRVLSVGVEDRDGTLARLQERVAARLADGGWYTPEARPYLPHVTAARVRGREPGAAALTGMELAPLDAPATFAGEAVALYRSHLGGSGARYEPLVRIPLQ